MIGLVFKGKLFFVFMTMNYIFFGPQGSGKGTQAKIIAERLGLCHISTGDLLRNATGELRAKADEYMNAGKLVPDEIVIGLLAEKLKSPECEKGFILDGFPRNLAQSEELDKIVKIDNAFNIKISDDESVKRLSSRISCKSCGTVFNLITNPPKEEMKCDKCGGELVRRADDTEEAIRKRLEIYHEETAILLKKYSTIPVNGEQPIEKVDEDIMKAIKMLNFFK